MKALTVVLEGGLRCRVDNGSGHELVFDAPVEFNGKGEAPSATDGVAAALAACVMTVMATSARKHGLDLKGMTATVHKELASVPVRRIGTIKIEVQMPEGVPTTIRPSLDRAAHACPVHQSLNPNIVQQIQMLYPD